MCPSNRFLVTENLNLALNAAKSIGLTVVNIGSGDLMEGRIGLGSVTVCYSQLTTAANNRSATPVEGGRG